MQTTKHRDQTQSFTLTGAEQEQLWWLVRQGRRALVAENPDYDSKFAIDMLYALDHTRGKLTWST